MDYMLIEIKEKRKLEETLEKYAELLMAVERKFKTETRHETALRYIKECENKSVVGEDVKPNKSLDSDAKKPAQVS